MENAAGSKMTSKAISEMAQVILDDLESKRNTDTSLCTDFKMAMDSQVDKIMESVDKTMVRNFENKNAQIQEKLQELCAINGRIEKLEKELANFREQLRNVVAPFLEEE